MTNTIRKIDDTTFEVTQPLVNKKTLAQSEAREAIILSQIARLNADLASERADRAEAKKQGVKTVAEVKAAQVVPS